MQELMKEKLEKMKDIEAPDDRKARLKAQRDLLIKQKQEERQNELKDAKEGKSDNKYSNKLFQDFLAIDKKVSKQEAKKKELMKKKSEDSPEAKPQEDDEAEVISKPKKKDMKSLFEDSDEENEAKKKEDEKARLERQRMVMKQAAEESNFK